MQALIDSKFDACRQQMIECFQMAQGPDNLNLNLEDLVQMRKMVEDRLKSAGKELDMVS